MTREKLKGMVKIVTLQRILNKAEEVDRDTKSDEITYWNGKNLFMAKKKSVKYWNIFQIMGS